MSGGASDQLPYLHHRHGVGVADGFEGIDVGLQIDDLLLQPFNGHGLGEYQQIVLELARRAGVDMDEREMLIQANAWEIRHGGFSGRTAQQFVHYLKAMGQEN